jgi:hypothetical protein
MEFGNRFVAGLAVGPDLMELEFPAHNFNVIAMS